MTTRDSKTDLAIGLVKDGRPEKATAIRSPVGGSETFGAEAQYTLGTIYKDLGRREEALGYFLAAIDSDKGHFKAHLEIAKNHFSNEKTEVAMRYFEKASLIQPLDDLDKILYAYCLLTNRRILDAFELIDEVFESIETLDSIGEIVASFLTALENSGHFADSLKLLDKYVRAYLERDSAATPEPLIDAFREWAPKALAPGLFLAHLRTKEGSYDEAINLIVSLANKHSLVRPIEQALFDVFARKGGYTYAGQLEEDLRDTEPVDMSQYFCERPFTWFEITPGGEVYNCCAKRMSLSIGNVNSQSRDEIINSPAAQEIRRSILDGDYRYCIRHNCRELRRKELPLKKDVINPKLRKIIDERRVRIDAPSYLRFSYDESCNLSCPSCRARVISAKGAKRDWITRITDDHALPMLDHAETVFMNGAGDIFTSRAGRKILSHINRERFPELKLFLITNGVLLTPEEWRGFPNIHDMVEHLRVSIDAASEETYRSVRRRGDFRKLLDNLEFMSNLRRKGIIRKFSISFVYQSENMHEMKDFVCLGKKLGCDTVIFERLLNWNTYSMNEYLARLVSCPSHPRHMEFLEFLSDPIFDDPIVEKDFDELQREAIRKFPS